MATFTTDLEEIEYYLRRYPSRGRPLDSLRFLTAHLAGNVVVAETPNSSYVFVPVYSGKQAAPMPGGIFKFAAFDARFPSKPPGILLGRPHDVVVGEQLAIDLAQDRRRTVSGLQMGEVVVDPGACVKTSRLKALFQLPLD